MAFSDSKMYDKLYNLKNFGIRGEELVAEIGTNAKMNEFCAIMGLCNLKNINTAISARKKLCEIYNNNICEIDGIGLFDDNVYTTKNYAYYPIIVTDEYKFNRNELYNFLHKKGIYTRKYFYPLTLEQKCYKNKYEEHNLNIAKRLAERIMVLPLYEDLSEKEVTYVIKNLRG